MKMAIRFDGNRPALRNLPPKAGEHTEEILAELGYAPAEIRAYPHLQQPRP